MMLLTSLGQDGLVLGAAIIFGVMVLVIIAAVRAFHDKRKQATASMYDMKDEEKLLPYNGHVERMTPLPETPRRINGIYTVVDELPPPIEAPGLDLWKDHGRGTEKQRADTIH